MFAISLMVGVIVGLLPGLPIWIGPMFLLPFIDEVSMMEIMIFWVGCSVGGQYFGSVAALLLRVPGEASSLIYIRDIATMSWATRLELIRQTAWGSFVASVMALSVMLGVSILDPNLLLAMGTFEVKFAIYVIMIAVLVGFSEKPLWAFVLMAIGIFLAEKTNYSFPAWFLKAQKNWDDLTILSVMLGLIVIPEWLRDRTELARSINSFRGPDRQPLQWKYMFKGGALGSLLGLIPGPGATISAWTSYRVMKGTNFQKLIAAESANNSGIIVGMFPFLIFGIPFGLDMAAVDTLFEIKNIEVPKDFFTQAVGGLNHFEAMLVLLFMVSCVYLVLSQNFIRFYTRLVQLLHTKLWMVYAVIICSIIYVDISYNLVDHATYFMYLCLSIVTGIWMIRKSINPLPLVLGFVLGDQMSWAALHFTFS